MADNTADSINKAYFADESMAQISSIFNSNNKFPSISLREFFNKEDYIALKKEVIQLKYTKISKPMMFSYSKSGIPENISRIINSKTLLKLLSNIINKKIKNIAADAYCLSWKDYSVLNDEIVEKHGIDIIIDFADDWKHEAGGSVVYVDGTGNFFKIPPSGNALTLVERKNGIQKFVQYLNHYAENKKRHIIIGNLKY